MANVVPFLKLEKTVGNWVLMFMYDDGSGISDGGVIIPHDDRIAEYTYGEGEHRGARARWGVIMAAPEDFKSDGVEAGRIALVDHAKWTRSFSVPMTNGELIELWGVNINDILMTGDYEIPERGHPQRDRMERMAPSVDWDNLCLASE